jgi:phage terminase large subunit GpA-like protein
MSKEFYIPKIKSETPFDNGERESYFYKEILPPAEWVENNMMLVEGAGYATTGKLVLFPWQREPINAIAEYDRVIYCGAVQTGKSLIAECALWYVIDNYNLHAMLCYAKRQTVEDVFQDRIKPTIQQVPFLRKLWDGNPDNLTKDKIKLRNTILRVASAQVQNDIATFSAGLIYASEVCKYREMGYDVVKALRGRQEAYNMIGRKKEILESSPIEVGDTLHREMFTMGVTNLEPYHPCPHCGEYQVLRVDKIKELPNESGTCDRNPERIRQNQAAQYECQYCKLVIDESHRIDMGERVVWAANDEKILSDGKLAYPRIKKTGVSFQWSRFIDYSFKFSEALARFYEAARAGSAIKLRTFKNEDLGQFSTLDANERPVSWLFAKCRPYTMRDARIPAGVLAVFCGVDTQDKGFYFVLRGYGAGKESWLLDCDYIPCDMESDQNYEVVFQSVNARINRRQLITEDNRNLFIAQGLIDRGGHRAEYVDYIVDRMENFNAYIGSTIKISSIVEMKKNDIVFGNKIYLSKTVAQDAEMSNWHLPEDITADYCKQFVMQYEAEEIDTKGNKKRVWKEGNNDHYRDCENLVEAGLIFTEIDKYLFNELSVNEIRKDMVTKEKKEEQSQPQENDNYFEDIQERWNKH